MKWDVICVGAGLTSLAFSAILQQRHPERRILLLDKHTLVGGYATVFKRPKVNARFDSSLHKLSGMGEGGNTRRFLAEQGLLNELDLYYHDELFAACSMGSDIPLPIDPAAFRARLIEEFPHEAAGIDRFLADVDLHGRQAYFQYQIMNGGYEPDFAAMRYARRVLKTKTVQEALSEFIGDNKLKELLAAPGIYVGGFPEQLGYLYYLHIVFANLYQGTAYVVGSSQRLSDALADRIRRNGGEILLSKAVTNILTGENNAATGVRTADGAEYFADRIVINASPQYALAQLFEDLPVLRPARERARDLLPSLSTTTLYMVLDRPPAELGFEAPESMIFSADHGECVRLREAARANPQDQALQEQAYWQASPMEVTNYHRMDPEGNMVLVANVLDSPAHWPKRKEDYAAYKDKKKYATEVLMRRLVAAKPALADHVIFAEMSTPRTYERFTNNTDGAGYGAIVGTDMSSHMFHYDFPISGVSFMSAWTSGPGYEAALGYGELRANSWK